jgi:hypothetical protein
MFEGPIYNRPLRQDAGQTLSYLGHRSGKPFTPPLAQDTPCALLLLCGRRVGDEGLVHALYRNSSELCSRKNPPHMYMRGSRDGHVPAGNPEGLALLGLAQRKTSQTLTKDLDKYPSTGSGYGFVGLAQRKTSQTLTKDLDKYPSTGSGYGFVGLAQRKTSQNAQFTTRGTRGTEFLRNELVILVKKRTLRQAWLVSLPNHRVQKWGFPIDLTAVRCAPSGQILERARKSTV